jgi:hypothetical protein
VADERRRAVDGPGEEEDRGGLQGLVDGAGDRGACTSKMTDSSEVYTASPNYAPYINHKKICIFVLKAGLHPYG